MQIKNINNYLDSIYLKNAVLKKNFLILEYASDLNIKESFYIKKKILSTHLKNSQQTFKSSAIYSHTFVNFTQMVSFIKIKSLPVRYIYYKIKHIYIKKFKLFKLYLDNLNFFIKYCLIIKKAQSLFLIIIL
uniref:Orf131 n=1 Tax=Synura synuroidea TaxID=47573 RepID=Q9MG99_9STRA|nr:orf131 [Synura synuroidea]AAF36950.1 orf131 [Synura synuroidea]